MTVQIISSLEIFFFAVAQFVPEQRKAQAEIDRVIGNTRLLTLDDRASLPYVEALYREVLRWMPAIPFGVAHATTDEDIYDEYYIPKGPSFSADLTAFLTFLDPSYRRKCDTQCLVGFRHNKDVPLLKRPYFAGR